MTSNERNLITRVQAAEISGRTLRTIDRWAKSGVLRKYENRAGDVRIDSVELARLINVYRPQESDA